MPSFTRTLGTQTWAPLFAQQAFPIWPIPCPGSKSKTFSFVASPPPPFFFLTREPPPLHHSPIPCHAHVFNSTKGLSSWQNSSTLGTWVCEAWGLGRSCSHGLEQCTDLTSRYHPWSVGILLKRMYASHLYQAVPPKSLLRAPHLPSCSMTRKSQYLWPQR